MERKLTKEEFVRLANENQKQKKHRKMLDAEIRANQRHIEVYVPTQTSKYNGTW